jgi:hypothetical protein
MSENRYQAILAELTRPFPPQAVQWKPGATTKDKSRAMALAYVDSREYIERLNEVIGGDWQDHYEVVTAENRVMVLCHLSVAGVTRTGNGECDLTDSNAMTSASAQAFKRACVKHGLGAYLYDLPRQWVGYDAQKKQFTRDALARSMASLAGDGRPLQKRTAAKSRPPAPRRRAAAPKGNGSGESSEGRASRKQAPATTSNGGNGEADPIGQAMAVELPFGKYRGKNLGDVMQTEPGYVEWLAENARSQNLAKAAATLVAAQSASRPPTGPPF